jgi:hypothetical protein
MNSSRGVAHPFACSAKAWDHGAQALEKLRNMHRNPVWMDSRERPNNERGTATAATPTMRRPPVRINQSSTTEPRFRRAKLNCPDSLKSAQSEVTFNEMVSHSRGGYRS